MTSTKGQFGKGTRLALAILISIWSLNPGVFAAVADTSNITEAPQPVIELAEEPINPAPADPGTGPVNTNNEEGPLTSGQAFVQTGVPPQPQPGGPQRIVPAIDGWKQQINELDERGQRRIAVAPLNPPAPAVDVGMPITDEIDLRAERFSLGINGTYTNRPNATLGTSVSISSFQAFRQSDGRIRVVFYTYESAQPGMPRVRMEVFSIVFRQSGWSESVSIAPAYAARLGIDPGTARLRYHMYFANTRKAISVDFFRIVVEARQFPSGNFILNFLWPGRNRQYTDGSRLESAYLLRQRVTR